MWDAVSSAPSPTAAMAPQHRQPTQMPNPAKAACFAPSAVDVRSTRIVSKPGVIVSRPAASVKARSDCAMLMPRSQNDARVTDALIAFQQIDLLGDDLPAALRLRKAVAGPAAKEAGLVAPELVDEEIATHHARVIASGRKDLHVGDQPHGARGRRLRPGKARAQAVDAVFETAAVIEHDGDLAPRVAGIRRGGNPIDAFGREQGEPLLITELVEQPRLAFQYAAEEIARRRVGDDELVALPIGKIRDQLAVERIGDVMRRARRVRRGFNAHGHGSR